MENYFKHADTIPYSSGNVLEPVEYGTSVHGCWSLPATEKKKAITQSVFVAGALIGLAMLVRKR
jgi:hypothetical protein